MRSRPLLVKSRPLRPMLTAIAALTVVALLSGCAPAKLHGKTPSLAPSPTPLFTSEDEALAAAEAAYTAYAAASDLISSEGGADPRRIEPFVTSAWLDHEMAVFEQFAESGRRQVGESTVRRAILQSLVSDDGLDYISVYFCVDFAEVRFLDANGTDVTPSPRGDVLKLLVEFEAIGLDDVRIAQSEPWSGDLDC